MRCKICNNETRPIFQQKILLKYLVGYYKCNSCDYIFTDDPYWLDEAYSSAIAQSDTGLIARNINFSIKVPILLSLIGCDIKKDKFIDYAGGGGVFVRLMRDKGLDFYWYDKFCQNWVANGFEADLSLKYVALTMFECLEHLPNPLESIQGLSCLSDILIFSTELIPSQVPDKSWWYYSFETGQHISFFSENTLKYLANKLNYHYFSVGNVHVFSRNKICKLRIEFIKLVLNKNKLCSIFFRLINLQSKIQSDHLKMKEFLSEEK